MDWEQKLQALNAVAECKLIMRSPGDWYVSQSVEVKSGSVLKGLYGNGRTPEEAVNEHWQELTELKPGEYLIGREYFGEEQTMRKVVRWNGFMWDHVEEKPKANA